MSLKYDFTGAISSSSFEVSSRDITSGYRRSSLSTTPSIKFLTRGFLWGSLALDPVESATSCRLPSLKVSATGLPLALLLLHCVWMDGKMESRRRMFLKLYCTHALIIFTSRPFSPNKFSRNREPMKHNRTCHF